MPENNLLYNILFLFVNMFQRMKAKEQPIFHRLFLGSIEFSAHQHTHDRRHHQPPRPSARVAETVEAFYISIEFFVHLYPVAVEFQLGRIEKSFN